MPTAIREMPLWKDHGFESQILPGLSVRRGTDASGRDLVVVSNQAHKAYSFPISLLESGLLPQFFVERIKTL